jgi:hypothetical protein
VDPLIQVILTSSFRSNRHFLGRSRSSNLCPRERKWIGLGQVQPHLAGPAAPTGSVAPVRSSVPGGAAVPIRVERRFQFRLKCVPTHKNYNTTRGTLSVPKMCMKLVIYTSRTQGFDGRIFVVRTVNTGDALCASLAALLPPLSSIASRKSPPTPPLSHPPI